MKPKPLIMLVVLTAAMASGGDCRAEPPPDAQYVFITAEMDIPGYVSIMYRSEGKSEWFKRGIAPKNEVMCYTLFSELEKWNRITLVIEHKGSQIERDLDMSKIPKAGNVLIRIEADWTVTVEPTDIKHSRQKAKEK